MRIAPFAAVAALASLAVALTLAAPVAADGDGLVGFVGPSFTISLQDAAGNPVTSLAPGTYTLLVHDRSDIHDFHLKGPGVDVQTDIEFVGDQTFTITITDGRYTFVCDAHFGSMKGSFTGGNPPPPSSPPAKPKPVTARVGPGRTLSFPARLAHGRYAVTVHDATATANLHLKGPGVDRKTSVPGRGTTTWNVTLKAGTYRVGSDTQPALAHTVKVT
jgi:plastocyanin